jgi:hypothetical protein
MDASEIIQRLQGVVSDEFIWPTVPLGWRLEFIAYSKDDVIVDLLHPISNKFWSEDNEQIDIPFLNDGSMINVSTLQNAGIPFMTTFGKAKVVNKQPTPHLSIVNNSTFRQVKAELEAKGTLAGVIEHDQDGEWLGMIYEKDLSFKDPREQDHFAKCVFNGSTRI